MLYLSGDHDLLIVGIAGAPRSEDDTAQTDAAVVTPSDSSLLEGLELIERH